MNVSFLIFKDEIKKGSFVLEMNVDDSFAFPAPSTKRIQITDVSGSDGFKINSPVGEYGILFATASNGTDILRANQHFRVGLIFYQAGVAVISGSIFNANNDNPGILDSATNSSELSTTAGTRSGFNFITGSAISASADAIRNRIYNLSFNNTTELNSTIYFCRINHNEFNYSANPTYLSSSQIRVKVDATDVPISYITSIGLYDNRDRLLAVGKLSEPLRKDPTVEYTLRARLDY